MSCQCINAKKKDFDYIEKLAILYSKSEKTDVQIYTYKLVGVGYVFDFEPKSEKRGGIVKIIEFQQPESSDVLRDSEQSELAAIEPAKNKGKRRKADDTLVSDSGELLS